jgi:rod shape determining protein RodA
MMFGTQAETLSIGRKLLNLNWGLLSLLIVLASVGFMALYSAAGGSFDPWAKQQMIRFMPMIALTIMIALIDIKIWFFLAWPLWALGLVLLIFVELFGFMGMGAQRWIDLGVMKLQPSELMKIAVIMVLARCYHLQPKAELRSLIALLLPTAVILVPVALVLMQPDLGTALMIMMAGIAVIFLGGVWWGYFAFGAAAMAIAGPLFWMFGMKPYQKERVMTFLNPESDPLGAGYHITQSKIAIGSGGWSGKGFTEGSQSRLNFLPEKQTDFIFTHFAEEWGFIGGVVLLGLLVSIIAYCYIIAYGSRHKFGFLLAMGLMINFSLYVFINIGMVMGLLPVVGAPLPLVSYGGTSMLSAMISFGLIMCVWIHRNRTMPKADFD